MDVKSDVIVDACVVVDSTTVSETAPQEEAHKSKQIKTENFPISILLQLGMQNKNWWAVRDLNPRPPARHAGALAN